MNTRQKGRKAELKAKSELEHDGWIVALTDMPQKYKKSQDFFGCWDIIAIRENEIKLIQVRTNQRGDIRPQREFKEEYFYNHMWVNCEVWVFITESKKWKKVIL